MRSLHLNWLGVLGAGAVLIALPVSADIPGKLNRKEFEEALAPNLKAMRTCYDEALKKDALAEGALVLKIETANGKVRKAEVDKEKSTLKLESVHTCVSKVAGGMKLPLAKNAKGEADPTAVATVMYPIEFSLGIDVEGAAATISGAKLEEDKVKKVFFYERLSIGACFLDSYRAKKGVAPVGKLVLKVEVVGGVVSKSDEGTGTTVPDDKLKRCVLDAVKKFKFPLAKDAAGKEDSKASSLITYPLEFTGK